MPTQLALRFEDVPVSCPVQARYHAIAPCAGITSPTAQAQVLHLGYSIITRWLREFRTHGLPGLVPAALAAHEPYTAEKVIVVVLYFSGEIQQIIADPELSAPEKITRITQLVVQREPAREQVTADMRELQRTVTTAEHDRDYYARLGQKSLQLQNRVADIVRSVCFDQDSAASSLLTAITYYQEKDGELDKHVPTAFLLESERALMFDEQGKFQVSLYKALLFVSLAEALRAGALNVRHSHKYRSLEDYLLPQREWQAARSEYLQRADLTRFADCHLLLRELWRDSVGLNLLEILSFKRGEIREGQNDQKTNAEVDIVLEAPSGEIVGVEVKATATPNAGDLNGLKALQAAVGKRFRRGILLHTGTTATHHSNDLYFWPLSCLWQ